MVVVGVLLVAVAVVLTAAAITSNGGSAKFDLWGVVHSTMSIGAVFLMGMITTIVGVLGILVLVGGMRRGRRLRKERKRISKEHEQLSSGPQLTGTGDLGATGTGTTPTAGGPPGPGQL